MADKVTASKSKKSTDPNDRVEELLEELREAMIDAGQDEGTVDALLFAAQPNQTNVVGNLADLQRMGARVVEGSAGGQAVEEAVLVSSVSGDDGGTAGTATQVQASTGEPVEGKKPSAAAEARAERDAESAQAAAQKDSDARAEAAEKKAAAEKNA